MLEKIFKWAARPPTGCRDTKRSKKGLEHHPIYWNRLCDSNRSDKDARPLESRAILSDQTEPDRFRLIGYCPSKLCSHNVADGIYKGQHKYLPFVKNGINSVASQGQDVVSYNFTGCIMAAFKEGGVAKVCHVSTGAGQDCKAEWDAVKGRSVDISEFRPSDFIETGGGAFGGCYGLVTADLKIYAITVTRPKAGSGMQIAAIKTAHLLD